MCIPLEIYLTPSHKKEKEKPSVTRYRQYLWETLCPHIFLTILCSTGVEDHVIKQAKNRILRLQTHWNWTPDNISVQSLLRFLFLACLMTYGLLLLKPIHLNNWCVVDSEMLSCSPWLYSLVILIGAYSLPLSSNRSDHSFSSYFSYLQGLFTHKNAAH